MQSASGASSAGAASASASGTTSSAAAVFKPLAELRKTCPPLRAFLNLDDTKMVNSFTTLSGNFRSQLCFTCTCDKARTKTPYLNGLLLEPQCKPCVAKMRCITARASELFYGVPTAVLASKLRHFRAFDAETVGTGKPSSRVFIRTDVETLASSRTSMYPDEIVRGRLARVPAGRQVEVLSESDKLKSAFSPFNMLIDMRCPEEPAKLGLRDVPPDDEDVENHPANGVPRFQVRHLPMPSKSVVPIMMGGNRAQRRYYHNKVRKIVEAAEAAEAAGSSSASAAEAASSASEPILVRRKRTLITCVSCQASKPVDEYSCFQRKLATGARCRACMDAVRHEGTLLCSKCGERKALLAFPGVDGGASYPADAAADVGGGTVTPAPASAAVAPACSACQAREARESETFCCTVCGVDKARAEFGPSQWRHRTSGRRTPCKGCLEKELTSSE